MDFFTNQMSNAVTTDLDWDAKSQILFAGPSTFQYNRVGSMTRMTEALGTGRSRITEVQVYDERQLPEELHIATHVFPTSDTLFVRYRYDANGQRIRKQVRATEHGPDILYERYVRDGMRLIGVFDENNTLQNWNIGGAAGLVGRADPATLGYTRRFYVTDHLGSIRAVVDQTGIVIEGRDYYPYGLTMPGRFYVQADTTREGYTGHELDKETGDYYAGARFYGPALARWFVVDPMAEAYPGWSPYNYTMGNPLMMIDPDGMCPIPPSSCNFSGWNSLRPLAQVLEYAYNRVLQGANQTGEALISQVDASKQIVGAAVDFTQNYFDMIEANTIDADKYFHCRANCEASARGDAGERAAEILSDLRENVDQMRGSNPEDSQADQRVNRQGRNAPNEPDFSGCENACSNLRPGALPDRYGHPKSANERSSGGGSASGVSTDKED